MKESFSMNTKRELLSEEKIKRCCLFSLLYGFLFLTKYENEFAILKKANVENAKLIKKIVPGLLKNKEVFYDDKSKEIRFGKGVCLYSTIAEYKEKIFKCETCRGYFLRAIFLACGTVSDPQKAYGLDLIFDSQDKQSDICNLLIECGLSPKTSFKKGKYVIYFRSSEQVENFLAIIGAVNATFAVMNSKIYKDVTNNVNRVANCDSANISKALKASEKYIDAIYHLINTRAIDSLSDQLKETALKRIEFKELNFEQLGKKFSPPISKSGIYHRLEKILELYKNLLN